MTTSDFRIPRARAAGVRDDELFWRLIEPIWPDASVRDERAHVARGTPGQRALYSTTLFIRDVDNGGLDQAFWNLDPWFIDLVLASLDLLGAGEHAAAVRAALRAIFGEQAPADLEERRDVLEGKDRDWLDAEIEPLNERLYGEERLYPLFRRYVEAHPEEFFTD